MEFFEMLRKEEEALKLGIENTDEDLILKIDRVLEVKKREIKPLLLNLKKQLEESKLNNNENIDDINEKLEILEKDFYDLNSYEVKKIGMVDEHDVILYMVCGMIAKYTPGNEKGEKMYYYKYKDAKKLTNDDICINTFVDFFKRYVYMTYDEVLKDIKKLKSGRAK